MPTSAVRPNPRSTPAYPFSFGLPAHALRRPQLLSALRDLLSLLLVLG